MQVYSIDKLTHKIDAKTISTVTFDFTNSFSSVICLSLDCGKYLSHQKQGLQQSIRLAHPQTQDKAPHLN
jgi:hypothetical protein